MEEYGGKGIQDAAHLYVLFDHIVPRNNSTTAALQHELREFACGSFLQFSDIGGGICHQVMSEGVVLPGEVVVGADSHTCTLGAFGAFATGVGATDMAAIWMTGETWFRVPESIGIHLSGTLSGAAEAKDLALTYVGRLGMDGATYQALEFIGEGAAALAMDDRLTLSNLAVETGAKPGCSMQTISPCSISRRRDMKPGNRNREPCRYQQELDFDLTDIVPVIAGPPRCGYDTACIRSGRGAARSGLCGHLHKRAVFRSGTVCQDSEGKKSCCPHDCGPCIPGCAGRSDQNRECSLISWSPCWTIGTPVVAHVLELHMGVIGAGEVCLSTANRNFKNRMGTGGEIYLSQSCYCSIQCTGRRDNPTAGGILMPGKGRAVCIGTDIDTDQIIAGRYLRTKDHAVWVEHIFEDLDPSLARRMNGAVIIAGKNFGCGSSREQAVLSLSGNPELSL